MIPELTCYVVRSPQQIVPARAERRWMDETNERYAYRCIPLTIANASGWEVLCPVDFEATWNGGQRSEDIILSSSDNFVQSHFRHGILTFHLGYMFRTSPGWATWFRGPPNSTKGILTPLEGLVETDWLPYTATMNWRFSEPGTVKFEKDEPFCFITLVPHAVIDCIQPVIRNISDNAKEEEDYKKWETSRNDFNRKLSERDPEACAKGWEKKYVRGEGSGGFFHISKRRLKQPISLGKAPESEKAKTSANASVPITEPFDPC